MIKTKINNLIANPYIGFSLYFIFHGLVFGEFDFQISRSINNEVFARSINIGFFLAPVYAAVIAGVLYKKKFHSNYENGELLINAGIYSLVGFLINMLLVCILVGQFLSPSILFVTTYAMLAPFAIMAGLSIGTWCVSEK